MKHGLAPLVLTLSLLTGCATFSDKPAVELQNKAVVQNEKSVSQDRLLIGFSGDWIYIGPVNEENKIQSLTQYHQGKKEGLSSEINHVSGPGDYVSFGNTANGEYFLLRDKNGEIIKYSAEDISHFNKNEDFPFSYMIIERVRP